jgi:hypothetical protein
MSSTGNKNSLKYLHTFESDTSMDNCQLPVLYEMARNLFKRLSQDEDRRIYLKTFRASLFNDDLSNEPNFGRISLDLTGQYL